MVSLLLLALGAEPPDLVRLPTGSVPVDGSCPGAQVEPEGAGHCCWRGQVWNVEGQSCVGSADCPPGTTIGVDGCFAAADVSAPAPKTVHWSELQVKRRVSPASPPADDWGTRTEVRCVMRVTVDPEGTPTSAEPKDCPAPFDLAARAALLEWRFYPPPPREGSPGDRAFDISVNFRR